MVAIVIAFPGLVTSTLHKSTVDPSKIEINVPTPEYEQQQFDRSSDIPDFGAPKDGAQKEGQPSKKPTDKKAEPQTPAEQQGEDLEKLFKSK
jgi:hypothetical protein